MFLKRYFIEGLAHASYLIGSGGEAAVIDPKRDVDDYLTDAAANGLKIVAIFNSHPHADFASGFLELAARTGARNYTSHLAPVSYERVAARDGQRVTMGDVQIEIRETPGHSPDSLSFLVLARGQPTHLFTGDLLFVGDVGRPDLRDADADPKLLAGELYDSLHTQILTLPDALAVHPAHGAGSLCGRALGTAPQTTVGQERAGNWALQFTDRDEFARVMTANLPDRPAYFSFDVALNLAGAPALATLPAMEVLSEAEVHAEAAAGAVVIDIRGAAEFGSRHVPGSLNIGFASPMFATWTGFLVPGAAAIILVATSAVQAAEARLSLARIGFDRVIGFIDGDELEAGSQLSQFAVVDVRSRLQSDSSFALLDVRNQSEWEAFHVEASLHVPLPQLARRHGELPHGGSLAVICGSGYRSSIGASFLQRAGFGVVGNVMGGIDAWRRAHLADAPTVITT